MPHLLHRLSPGRFAPTCILDDEHQARQSATLRFLPCRCGIAGLVRIRRPLWMRLVPGLRLYQCRRCWAMSLRPRVDRKTPYGYVYRPSVTLPRAPEQRRK